jgi:DNA mismatch repair protein MLH1
MIALNCKESGWTENDGPKETLAEFVVDFLKSKADLIKEHFLFTITEEGEITSLPMLIPSLQPNMDRLPMLLLRLATDVNWNTEKSCFDGFAKEYSKFCAIRYDPFLVDSEEKKGQDGTEKDGEDGQHPTDVPLKYAPWRWQVEHLLVPLLRSDFIPLCSMATDGSVLQLADLHDLYKVFERC